MLFYGVNYRQFIHVIKNIFVYICICTKIGRKQKKYILYTIFNITINIYLNWCIIIYI